MDDEFESQYADELDALDNDFHGHIKDKKIKDYLVVIDAKSWGFLWEKEHELPVRVKSDTAGDMIPGTKLHFWCWGKGKRAKADFIADQDFSISPKPKRTLQFTTPKSKPPDTQLTPGNNARLIPLRSPMENLNGSLLNHGKLSLGSSQKKRSRQPSGGMSDSDLEYDDDDDVPSMVPQVKRTRIEDPNLLDEDELWGDNIIDKPKSPKHMSLHVSRQPQPLEPMDDPDLPPSPDRLLMEKIILQRSKHSGPEITITSDADRNHRLVDDYDFERKRVYSRIPACAYLPTTGTGGDRVYMHMRQDVDLDREFASYGKTVKNACLLGVSMPALREQLEDERRSMLLAQSEALSEEVHRQLNEEDTGLMDDDDDVDKENPHPEIGNTGETQRLLWVDKYAPHRYTDLLSEESTNRALLHWLKLWDYVVFNKELPAKKKETIKKEEHNTKFKKKQPTEILDELDSHKRPIQRVALLCGPPGLGKTTLAHIIAKHAGYNVVEMNASDDRSAEVFKTKIEAATQMKAVLGADPRPNCLVIDEIDGAPQPAINVLLNLLKKTETGEGQKKKKKEETILLRPIICVCNDQYVPSLRQLRQSAMLLNFPQTDPQKLAARLYEVVRYERLKSDMNCLLALCEKTDNDIRSCLNTLQFIQRQAQELSLKTVQTMTVGQKDTHKSLFSVWYDILTLPKPKRHRYVNLQEVNPKDQVINTSPKARFSNILSVVQGAGEYDKLTQGLFENYLECKFKDPHMAGVSLATEWLCYTDTVNQYIQHVQDYQLMPYLPYTALTFHFLFASHVPPRIQFPHSHTENKMKKQKCEHLVHAMMADMSPLTRKFLTTPVAIMEILPPLMDIISPTFRPVNTQLYSAKEKEDLTQLVRAMIAYNMSYKQEKSPEGQYSYVLEPHVDEVVRFTGMKQHRQLTYASKQLVAREVELEKMRRSELARAPEPRSPVKTDGPPGKTAEGKGPQRVPNHLQTLSAKPLGKEEEVQIKDFFGRVIKRTTLDSKKGDQVVPEKRNVLATDIWFHFQSGYTNAVRRNIRIKDFF